MSLPKNVRELREGMGMSQAGLARKSGIPPATISRIESGAVKQPKIGQLRKLVKALDVSFDHLLADVPLEWQRVHRGWGKLSPEQKRHVANTVRLFGEGKEKCDKQKGGILMNENALEKMLAEDTRMRGLLEEAAETLYEEKNPFNAEWLQDHCATPEEQHMLQITIATFITGMLQLPPTLRKDISKQGCRLLVSEQT